MTRHIRINQQHLHGSTSAVLSAIGDTYVYEIDVLILSEFKASIGLRWQTLELKDTNRFNVNNNMTQDDLRDAIAHELKAIQTTIDIHNYEQPLSVLGGE